MIMSDTISTLITAHVVLPNFHCFFCLTEMQKILYTGKYLRLQQVKYYW